MSDPLLRVCDVSKVYTQNDRQVHALNNVSMDIYKGEIVSLLGVNGAGKTTLSSILATLHPPTSGDVLFNGESIYRNLLRYRRAIGFCPQRPNLDQYLTVRENLLFAGRYFLMPKKEILTRTDELLKLFHLERYADFNVNALSGGYKQRLLIARALMHNPEIVILDEPTVGLDPDIRRQLWDIIMNLKKRGITVIITTHYLEEAEILSDRVIMLNRGKVILTAGLKDLKAEHKQETLEQIFLELVEKEEQGGE